MDVFSQKEGTRTRQINGFFFVHCAVNLTSVAEQTLTLQDRFEIYEQLNLHQRLIDTGWGKEPARKYTDLYWPEGKFNVVDIRHSTFEGPAGLKQMFDYAHSVFPLDKMFHTMGTFQIAGDGTTATADWRWIVNWKEEQKGVLSTGTYSDRFEKRNGVWKCLERTSVVDPNFPADVFQSWSAVAEKTFRES